MAIRLFSLGLIIAAWFAGAWVADPQSFLKPTQIGGSAVFPDPWKVVLALQNEAHQPGLDFNIPLTGSVAHIAALWFNLGATLLRVAVSFALAMAVGAAAGLVMGLFRNADRFGDPWLVVLLNLPALVIIVLAYVWVGLNETAAIIAVALNKVPIATVMVREGARSLDAGLAEMATVFRMGPWRRMRHVVLPQLAPYLAAAARSGLSLVWKIVLVVEWIGRPNGVGFEIGVAFQSFDVTKILAYALAFVAVMLVIETFLVQPLERHVSRWRPRTA